MIITSRIGGTSGPIWGTAFLRAGGAVTGADAIGGDDVVAMLRAAIEGIKQRGQSDVGDKTLLDALVPATDALEEELAPATARPALAAAAGRRARGRRGHQEHARQARARLLHGRAQHRQPGRRSRRASRSCSRSSPRPGPGPERSPGTSAVDHARRGGAVKKFVNDPKEFVPEMLKGIALANPDTLKYVPEYNLIMRTDAPSDDKVSIVQGSGSGHEPAHVMVVGKGMLDAACPGDVFAAPPMDYV